MRRRLVWGTLAVALIGGCHGMVFSSWSSSGAGGGGRRVGNCVVSPEAIYEEGESEETCRSREEAVEERRHEQDRAAVCEPYHELRQAAGSDPFVARRIPGPDPVQGVMLGLVCDENENDLFSQSLFELDGGATNPIYPAALVILCPKDQDAYYAWRECREWLAQSEPAALKQALAQVKTNDYARSRFLARFEKARQDLEALAPRMADAVADYPGLALAYDDVRRDVDKTFVPRYREWLPELTKVDRWLLQVMKGPRFAGTCQADLTSLLQRYLTSVVPKATKERLLDAMRDPIGFRLTAALQHCLTALGNDDDARMLAYPLRDATPRGGLHFVLRERLAAVQSPPAKLYKGKRIAVSALMPGEDRTWEGFPLRIAGGNDYVYTVKQKVASLTRKGDQVLVKFKKATGTSYHMTDCKRTGRVSSIDNDGNVHYEENCREVKDTIDLTEKPVWLPAADAAHLEPGFTAAIDADFEAERHGRLLFVLNRSDDLVWLWGFTPAK
jgi:hypothetical protein